MQLNVKLFKIWNETFKCIQFMSEFLFYLVKELSILQMKLDKIKAILNF